MERRSVGGRLTVASRMAIRHSPRGVGRSRTEEECGIVVVKDTWPSLHILAGAIGVPNRASAGRCRVSGLLIVASVEITVETLGRQ